MNVVPSEEAQVSYEAGVPPRAFTEEKIEHLLAQIERAAVAQAVAQAADPGHQLSHGIDVSPRTAAKLVMRIVVEAGWRAPEWPAQTGEAA